MLLLVSGEWGQPQLRALGLGMGHGKTRIPSSWGEHAASSSVVPQNPGRVQGWSGGGPTATFAVAPSRSAGLGMGRLWGSG